MASTTPHLSSQTDAERIAADAKQKAAEAQKLEAAEKKAGALERRVKHLERTFRTFITTKSLTERQRTDLLGVLAGTSVGGTNPILAGFAVADQRLLENFHKLNGNNKRLASRLFSQLAELESLQTKRSGRR